MASLGDRQLWLGSIPNYLDEQEALAELFLHRIRPVKLVLRASRVPEGDLNDNCLFFSWHAIWIEIWHV